MTGIATIAEASARIASGALSSADLTESCLARIDRYDGRLSAFHEVFDDAARRAAEAADAELKAGRRRGPLHGIPVGYKDVFHVAGEVATANSKLLADFRAAEDATVIQRLKAAGAVLVGRLNTFEFAFGGPAYDLPFPPARNPWDPERWPGAGSSGGSSVAVAAGFCLGALGTDAGGSIRSPASMSGIAGLKPTLGRVSTYGDIPATFSTETVGPMAWTAEDCALMLQVLAGHDAKDPGSADEPVDDYCADLDGGVRGTRVGIIRQFFERDYDSHPEIIAATNAVGERLAELGADVGEVDGLSSLWDYHAAGRIIFPAEVLANHEENLRERPDEFGELLRNRAMLGSLVRAVDYIQAQRLRRELVQEMERAFETWDVLLSPGMLLPPARLADKQIWPSIDLPMIDVPYSLTGHPSLAICGGFFADGLPIGVQLAGGYFEEATVLRVAHAYEQAMPWRQNRPDLDRIPESEV